MVLARTSEMSSPAKTASPSRQITVVDVYDLAAAIGKDFEHLIDQFGTECVRGLMPKVISALETLEALASTNERENEEIVTLKKTVERFEVEKTTSKGERARFEQELEQREDTYRKEIADLFDVVQKLQNENQRLSSSLNEQDMNHVQTLREEDLTMMIAYKSSIDQQRDQIKALQRDCETKTRDLDRVQVQVEKLQRQHREVQRKNKAIQNQGRVLVEEKSELISQLQQKEEMLIRVEHQLGETEKAKKDLEQSKVEETQGLDRENMPRFTLKELREVLEEKNRLKARVMELEEELVILRPSAAPSPQPPVDEKGDDELVVYGPMPREPEEKLYPWKYQRRDSGVRKLFRWATGHQTETPEVRMSEIDADRVELRDGAACACPSDSSSRTAVQTPLCRPGSLSQLLEIDCADDSRAPSHRPSCRLLLSPVEFGEES